MSDKSTEHIGVLADTLLSSTMKYYTSTTEFNCRIDLHAHQMYVCVMDKQGKSWSTVTSQSSRATITSPQESTTDNQGNFLRGRRRAANFFREIVFEISILTTERTGGLC